MVADGGYWAGSAVVFWFILMGMLECMAGLERLSTKGMGLSARAGGWEWVVVGIWAWVA